LIKVAEAKVPDIVKLVLIWLVPIGQGLAVNEYTLNLAVPWVQSEPIEGV